MVSGIFQSFIAAADSGDIKFLDVFNCDAIVYVWTVAIQPSINDVVVAT
jgi:hypothetical protein